MKIYHHGLPERGLLTVFSILDLFKQIKLSAWCCVPAVVVRHNTIWMIMRQKVYSISAWVTLHHAG